MNSNVNLDFDGFVRSKLRMAIMGTASQMISIQWEAGQEALKQGDFAPVHTESVEELINCFAVDAVEFLYDCDVNCDAVRVDKEKLREMAYALVKDDKDFRGALAMMALKLQGYHIDDDSYAIIIKESDVRDHFEVE